MLCSLWVVHSFCSAEAVLFVPRDYILALGMLSITKFYINLT